MIDFYYWPTPNGWKVAIMLEECGLEYRMIPVNIGRGDQLKPEFLSVSPNNRMPAIVDHDGPDGPMPSSSTNQSRATIRSHYKVWSSRMAPHGSRCRSIRSTPMPSLVRKRIPSTSMSST